MANEAPALRTALKVKKAHTTDRNQGQQAHAERERERERGNTHQRAHGYAAARGGTQTRPEATSVHTLALTRMRSSSTVRSRWVRQHAGPRASCTCQPLPPLPPLPLLPLAAPGAAPSGSGVVDGPGSTRVRFDAGVWSSLPESGRRLGCSLSRAGRHARSRTRTSTTEHRGARAQRAPAHVPQAAHHAHRPRCRRSRRSSRCCCSLPLCCCCCCCCCCCRSRSCPSCPRAHTFWDDAHGGP
jgi:hypothetical protein